VARAVVLVARGAEGRTVTEEACGREIIPEHLGPEGPDRGRGGVGHPQQTRRAPERQHLVRVRGAAGIVVLR
jgi:hypothetical protein